MNSVEQPDGSYLSMYGTIMWFNEHGQYHKEDGPAAIRPNGRVSWWLNGTKYPFKSWLKQTPITDELKLLLRLQYDE
jgi:hypothetical protein